VASFAPASLDAPLLAPSAPAAVASLLEVEGADGWLLYDFRDQNPLAHRLLGLGKTTRRAFALFRRSGPPVLLRHAIEASSWRGWPWESRSYASWEALEAALADLLAGLESVAMEVSPRSAVPTVDRVPSGIVQLVEGTGVKIVSSGNLVTHFHARWSEADLASHRRAAEAIRQIAHEAFERAGAAVRAGAPLLEGELAQWIESTLEARGFPHLAGCIVAIGRTAADPHYHPGGAGERIEAGHPLLIDLWGAEVGGIPADQTWMAYLGTDPDPRTLEVWTTVRDARDAALAFLRDASRDARALQGWEVDRVARQVIEARGFGDAFVHRLGHSMDRDLHGSGPNLDDLETRDERRLITGVGFSVAPGASPAGEIGVRTEVNGFWGPEGIEITPTEIQHDLIRIPVEG
jgi:Xaa-Pro dipeptidase